MAGDELIELADVDLAQATSDDDAHALSIAHVGSAVGGSSSRAPQWMQKAWLA